MSRNASVSARLEAEIAAGRLAADAGQRAAARRLDALREALLASRAPLARLRAHWRRRFGGPRLGAASGAGLGGPGLGGAGRGHDPGRPRGLYLWGGVGRGKTLLMDMFCAALDSDGRVAFERTHFYRFMRAVHGALAELAGSVDPLDAVGRRFAGRVRVLCLDEFIVADIGDAMILAGLLQALLRHDVALVTTSNLAPAELYKGGLQRQRFMPAIELLERDLEIVHLDAGIDYRLRGLERAPIYFDAREPGTAAALEARFESLAGAAARGPSTLIIEGRPLQARASGPGMVWLEFAEACEGPRSQNDYIEIARLFGTLFLSNVPVFIEGMDDAARRFIMLIDELYDRGVKLVLSAMAPPAALYQGERLREDFARATSRLIEMQTASYLAGRHHA